MKCTHGWPDMPQNCPECEYERGHEEAKRKIEIRFSNIEAENAKLREENERLKFELNGIGKGICDVRNTLEAEGKK